MIRLNQIGLDRQELGKDFILTGIKDDKRYVDGKQTGERIGTKYEVALPAFALEKINVKVPGAQVIPDTVLDEKGMVNVSFEGLRAHFYSIDGRVGISATATSIKVIGN